MPALPARGSAVVLASALCLACGSSREELPQRAAPGRGIARPSTTSPAIMPPGSRTEVVPRSPSYSDYGSAARADLHAALANTKPTEPPPAAANTPRDYSAELSAALGRTAPSCLGSAKPSANGPLSIQFSATVMASGAVNRADVTAAGLARPELKCLEQLAQGMQLKGPIEGAPRTVRARVELQTKAGATPQPRAAADEPLPDDHNERPHETEHRDIDNDPPEVHQKLYEQTREAPEPPDPHDEPPGDNHAD